MTQSKTVFYGIFGITLFLSILYYYVYNLQRFYNFDPYEIRKRSSYSNSTVTVIQNNETKDHLINTPGCYIPDYSKNLRFKEAVYTNRTCGQRAVIVEKITDDVIKFHIDEAIMRKYVERKRTFQCCYRFGIRSAVTDQEDTHLTYTSCAIFHHDTQIELKHEVITVTCTQTSPKQVKTIYEDAYIILKKINKKTSVNKKHPWNVVLLGLDTMSRARFFSTMPQTARYLQQHGWLDYRGYQKVGYNTFPNLMSVLTGMNMSNIYKACANGMHTCNELLIWSKFRENGYVTAYGEDFLQLPDTFAKYKGFKDPPTDHYMRPFFLTGEKPMGNLICARTRPSALHTLDYAIQFSKVYRSSNFFGMFWINSISHNLENRPARFADDLVDFFKKINTTGVLDNTFIFFFSDHGIRYGDMRTPMESYYEERLPMLFMWIPFAFRTLYSKEYHSLQVNQNRLTSPYDFHATLRNILSNYTIEEAPAEACPQCSSLFEDKSPFRSCANAGVDKKWCSCHKMVKVDRKDPGSSRSLQIAVSYIQNRTKTIKTVKCKECSPLKLKSLIRSHSYVDDSNNNTYYVVAFTMTPGDVSYEATVEENAGDFNIVQPTNTISPYNTRGSCVNIPNERAYCICRVIKKCLKRPK